MRRNSLAGAVPEWTIQDRLRKARERTGMNATDFAAHVGVSRNTVGNYELGKTHPRRPDLVAWALASGVSLDWLEGGDDTTPGERWALRGSNPEPMVSGSALVGAGAGRLAGAGWAA